MQAPHLQAVPEPLRRTEPSGWLRIVRMEVDTRLLEFFEEKKGETGEISPPTLELVDEIEALTMRGGKRLRPAVAAAGYRCVRPGHGMARLVELSASLELLQSYLLIHDDWMDGDEVRRGGDAVHASLQQSHRDSHLGAALGVLAGDLASAYAWELFLEAPYPMQAWAQASAMFLKIQPVAPAGNRRYLSDQLRFDIHDSIQDGLPLLVFRRCILEARKTNRRERRRKQHETCDKGSKTVHFVPSLYKSILRRRG